MQHFKHDFLPNDHFIIGKEDNTDFAWVAATPNMAELFSTICGATCSILVHGKQYAGWLRMDAQKVIKNLERLFPRKDIRQ